MHKGRFVEKREHAVEILEEVLKQGERFFFGREWLEHASRKDVAENLGFPVHPLVVIDVRRGNHILEGCVARFFVDPLNTLWREYRES
jgi:hypothetical protein